MLSYIRVSSHNVIIVYFYAPNLRGAFRYALVRPSFRPSGRTFKQRTQ